MPKILAKMHKFLGAIFVRPSFFKHLGRRFFHSAAKKQMLY